MARSVLILAANALVALVAAAPAAADTFVVTKRGDPAPDGCKPRDCSLREAVLRASTHPGRDVIELPSGRKPYTLTRVGSNEDAGITGDLDISNHPLVIRHPGKGRATVDGGSLDRVFEVFAGAPTRFRKLVITGGSATGVDSGGGIRSEALIKVIGSRIAGNSATRRGGGIELADDAGLRLTGSTVAGNDAGFSGGGIDTNDSLIEIRRSRISGNRAAIGSGGGLFNDSASKPGLRIIETTIARNRSELDGGGVYLSGPAPLRIAGSTISGNRSGRGGGLFATVAKPRLANSTVASNQATGTGGGIFHASDDFPIALNAVTVARNVADADADGSGSGGGLFRNDSAAFEVENSLIALNRLGSGERNDCDQGAFLEFDSLGHNLISFIGMSDCRGFDRPTDLLRAPRIGKLKRNGGPTQTIALRKGSPAINKAKRSTAPKKDQRRRKRGRKKDIGAFERSTGR